MKTVTDLVPLGIGIAILAGVTWFLLDRDIGFGKWLLAFLLFAHGWVHVMFVFPQPEAATAGGPAWPFDMGRSWLIAAGMDPATLRAIGIAAMAVTLGAFILAALATAGVVVPVGWWAGLVIAAAACSTLLLAMFFSPALLLGFAINIGLVAVVLTSLWSPVEAAARGAGVG